jgi:asparaginyl-tRNA synthetase
MPPTIRAIIARSAPLAIGNQAAASALPTAGSSDAHLDDKITVKGWIKSIRSHKNVSFAAISDGSTSETLQAVLKGPALLEK